MDPAPANIQKIASKDVEISSFFDFCEKVDKLSNCKEATCEIKMFVKTLGSIWEMKQKPKLNAEIFSFLIVITLKRFLNLCLL